MLGSSSRSLRGSAVRAPGGFAVLALLDGVNAVLAELHGRCQAFADSDSVRIWPLLAVEPAL